MQCRENQVDIDAHSSEYRMCMTDSRNVCASFDYLARVSRTLTLSKPMTERDELFKVAGAHHSSMKWEIVREGASAVGQPGLALHGHELRAFRTLG